MKTVGELLHTARTQRGLDIAAIAQSTKIQTKYIVALEANNFDQLPEAPFVKGFIKNYAQVVDLNPDSLLAIFRRDYAQGPEGKVVPRSLVPALKPGWHWTPQATAIASATVLVTLFLAYLIFQFRILSGSPPLSVREPQEDQTVSALVTVTGTTDPQATVTVNHQEVLVNAAGEFTTTVSLTPGQHTLTIEARSRTGATKTLQRTVTVSN